MKCKKSIACVLSIALLGTSICSFAGNSGLNLFSYQKVSAAAIVPYAIDVSLSNSSFTLKEGSTITIDLLKKHGISVDEIVGCYHDFQSDPLYGQLTKTDITQTIQIEDCNVTIPEKLVDGENQIEISYLPVSRSESFRVSTSITVYVTFSDEEEPVVTTVDPPQEPAKTTTSESKSEPQDPPVEQPTYGNVTFDLGDSIAKPGETTYLDINIGENSGFCSLLLQLVFDDNIFSIKSISTTSDFTGDEYNLKYNASTKKMLFMNNCRTNIKTPDTDIIRVALEVKEDAPEGDYTIGLTTDKSIGGAAGHIPGKSADDPDEIGLIGITLLDGTVSVSKSLAPKTNVSSMPLGRVYAAIEGQESTYKTGDTTGDGRINALDAIKMVQYFTGTDKAINNADIDENGKLNVADLIKLKNYITLG